MTRDEFTKIYNEQYPAHAPLHLSDREWQIIEQVYNYHPCIDDKMHIVMLYANYGMTVISDMYDRAYMIAGLEADIEEEINKIERIKARMNAINSRDNVAMCHEED